MSETIAGTGTDVVDMVQSLSADGPPQRPVRHQAIVLLWALGRLVRGEPRLTRWTAARSELRTLLAAFGLPESRPTPEYPFVALARTEWWDLADARTSPPTAHSSSPLTWLTAENPRGGLTLALTLRLSENEGELDRAVQALLDRFFPGERADGLLEAVGLPAPEPIRTTTRLTWTWDELVLACDLLSRNGWHELPEEHRDVVALSALLQLLPIHPVALRRPDFRSPGSVRRKMTDIATQHPDSRRARTRGNKLDKEVLDGFIARPDEMRLHAEALRSGLQSGELQQLPEVIEEGVSEGRLLERRHYVRERNPKLRAKKIEEALQLRGRVECETCGFDFERTYGDRGAGYAECHHAVPLHVSGETSTRLVDLVLLCANCHRMIHRAVPWLTPEELRALVAAQRGVRT